MDLEKQMFPHRRGDREISILTSNRATPRHLTFLLDAECYLSCLDAVNQISELDAAGKIRPSIFVFVSNIDETHRHRDFACDNTFADYIARDLFHFIKSRVPSLDNEGHLIAGLSLSGLASTYIRMRYPKQFSTALCQSGSFWWNHEWLKDQVDDAAPGKYWISVGNEEVQSGLIHPPSRMRQEVCQVEATQRFVDALRNNGHQVQHEVFEGGHGNGPSARELKAALAWLLPPG